MPALLPEADIRRRDRRHAHGARGQFGAARDGAHRGDDYEIVLTLAPEKLTVLRPVEQSVGVAATEIGRITAGQGTALSFARPSYSHF